MHTRIRLLAAVLLCTFLVGFLPTFANAAGPELDVPCNLEIVYQFADQPLEDAQFQVYRVGQVNTDGSCSLVAPYSVFPIVFSDLGVGVSEVADMLYGYILLNQIAPDAQMTTGQNGRVSMTVSSGLYLIIGEKLSTDAGVYTTDPILVALPYKEL